MSAPTARPAVSVVVPCYNQALYLVKAIASVQAQTYAAWELIVVDDGSTDGTPAVAQGTHEPRLRYLYQENRGLPAARNTGLRAARGTYVAFLDADDEWEPTFLEQCVAVLRENPALGAVFTRCGFLDPTGNRLPALGGQVVPEQQVYHTLLQEGFFPVHTVLAQTAAVVEAGAFDESLTALEDWDLWLRLAVRRPMHSLPDPLALVRVRPGSMSGDPVLMHGNRLNVLIKRFGEPTGDPETWPRQKRYAFGFGLRTSAFGYMAADRWPETWRLLREAVELWPELATRTDTYYEIAYGTQPRGLRGSLDAAALESAQVNVRRALKHLFRNPPPGVAELQQTATATALLTLAMLYDRHDRWGPARQYLWRAVRLEPDLLRQPIILRRLLKLSLTTPRLRDFYYRRRGITVEAVL